MIMHTNGFLVFPILFSLGTTELQIVQAFFWCYC